MLFQKNHLVRCWLCIFTSCLVLAGCSGAIPKPAPATTKPIAAPVVSKPAPKPAQAKPVVPPTDGVKPASQSENWTTWTLAPGVWRYDVRDRATFAVFGQARLDPLFAIACETATKKISLGRLVENSRNPTPNMRVRASEGLQNWATRNVNSGPTGQVYHGVTLSPTDPMLDMMAFSRGRFAVEVDGETPLAVPAWPEMARVIEDCR